MSLLNDGLSQFARLPVRNSVNMATTAFTICGTFRTPETIPTVDQHILSFTSTANTSSSGDAGCAIVLRADGTFGAHSFYGLERKLNTAVVAAPNTNYRFVLTKDTGSNGTLYINSLGAKTTYGSFTTNKVADLLFVGAKYNYAGNLVRFTPGKTTRVGVWLSALGNTDITYLLTEGNDPSLGSVPPVDYWPLGDNAVSSVGGTTGILGGSPLPSWDADQLSSVAFPAFAAINGTDLVRLGSTANTCATSNISTISTARIGTTNVTGLVTGSNSVTFNFPGLVDGVASGLGTKLLFMSDGTKAGTRSLTVIPPATYDSVTLAAGFVSGDSSILKDFSPAAAIGDKILYQTAKGLVLSSGVFQTSYVGTQTMWHVSATDDIARSFVVTTGPTGSVVSINLTGFLPNHNSPRWDGAYPNGNRP